MNVFLQKYLEAPTQSSSIKAESWQWTPEGEFAQEIYASGCELSRNLRISVTKLENGARHFSAVGTVIA